MPFHPVFGGVLNCIFYQVAPRCKGGFYVADNKYTTSFYWKHFEEECRRLVRELLAYYELPLLHPDPDDFDIGLGLHESVKDFHREVRRQRQWFAVWMGKLSFVFEAAMIRDQDSPADQGKLPGWMVALQRAGADGRLIKAFEALQLGLFKLGVECIGTFIDLMGDGRTYADWLYRFSVPIWYSWGTKEANAFKSNPWLARFYPSPEHFQSETTFITKSPSNPTPLSAAMDNSMSKHPLLYCEKMKKVLAERLETESVSPKTSLLNKLENPPMKSTSVYVWESDGSLWTRCHTRVSC